jgi:flagellar biosynthetic protein FliQ
MTLTFVPKMFVILISLLLFLPFMLSTLTTFTQSLVGRIVAG